jgi:cyclase
MRDKLWVGLLAGVVMVGSVYAQRDYSKVEIKATKLADKIYMLDGSGGNIGVSVGEDGVLIIDDQFAPLADKIKAAIGKLGGSEPTFVLNTHHHGDHTGGNAAFGEKAVIVAHENVRKRLSESRRNDQPLPKAALPEITYKDGLTVHFNGEAIRVVHFPSSHTDGDGVVFFKDSKVVHTGDLFFNGRFPYVDLGAGGTVQGAVKSITKLTSMIPADWQIIPGHGSNATLDDLKGYLKMLETTTSAVRASVAAGKSLAECQKAGVPAEYAAWGEGFISADRWIETIYNSYNE